MLASRCRDLTPDPTLAQTRQREEGRASPPVAELLAFDVGLADLEVRLGTLNHQPEIRRQILPRRPIAANKKTSHQRGTPRASAFAEAQSRQEGVLAPYLGDVLLGRREDYVALDLLRFCRQLHLVDACADFAAAQIAGIQQSF